MTDQLHSLDYKARKAIFISCIHGGWICNETANTSFEERISIFFDCTFTQFPKCCHGGSAAQIASQVEILQDTSKSSQERSAAAQALGVVELDSDAAARVLVEIIENDSDPKVRTSAAKALGMVGLPQAAYIQTLIQTLQNDGSPAVRYAAAEGLRIIGVDSAAAKQALKGAADNDSNTEVRRMASKVYDQITSTNYIL